MYKEISTESVISCVFQNQSDVSMKTCCITYQPCDQKGPQNFQECNRGFSHEIELDVSDSLTSDQLYCYTARISNGTHTVKVKGSIIGIVLIIIMCISFCFNYCSYDIIYYNTG